MQATATLPQRPRTCTIFRHGSYFNQSVPTSIEGAVRDRENFWHLYIYISPKVSTWRFLFKKVDPFALVLRKRIYGPQGTRNHSSRLHNSPITHIYPNYSLISPTELCTFVHVYISRRVLLALDAPTFLRGFLSSRWSRGDNQIGWACDRVSRIVHSWHYDRTTLHHKRYRQNASRR